MGRRKAVPKPRGDKRQRTKARLIEVAGEVIAEKGLDRTSLEEIAERAGMSRGAIYGNFRDKEELFLAVAATRWAPVIPKADEGKTLRERMRAYGEAVASAATARRAEAVGATSFVQYVLTHEPLRKQLVAVNAGVYAHGAKVLTDRGRASDLRIPADQFVKVVHALTEGLLILHALEPELLDETTIKYAFELLAT